MTTPQLCINCKHCTKQGSEWQCADPKAANVVDGMPQTCAFVRSATQLCGPAAVWFEAKK